jgi:guanyl-specific ribonuclease Sa
MERLTEPAASPEEALVRRFIGVSFLSVMPGGTIALRVLAMAAMVEHAGNYVETGDPNEAARGFLATAAMGVPESSSGPGLASGSGGPATASAASGARATSGLVGGVKVTSYGKVIAQGTVDVRATVEAIESGSLAPRDVFQNRPLPGKTTPELPVRPPRYYEEFVHPTPGVSGAGPQRIVRGKGGELYYTPDHYQTFIHLN